MMNVKVEEEEEPKEECQHCKKRFYGPLMLGRHLVKRECTKPDKKPLFNASVKSATITLLDSSDDNSGM